MIRDVSIGKNGSGIKGHKKPELASLYYYAVMARQSHEYDPTGLFQAVARLLCTDVAQRTWVLAG